MNTPLTNDDLILYFPNGLNPKFKEIMVVVLACENPISFEELCYKLVEHETMLKLIHAPVSVNYTQNALKQQHI